MIFLKRKRDIQLAYWSVLEFLLKELREMENI